VDCREDIDPNEELARIINDAQERDSQDESRFDDLAESSQPEPTRARRRSSRYSTRRAQ
jgi:hypothetical protein